MRVGIVSPVVIQVPGVASAWEHDAGIAELAVVARAADRLGFAHLTCSEHVAVPRSAAQQRGGVYWDPLATFGYLAACTERIRLVTQVLVLGYHHPLAIAKRYGTLDRISGGRLTLGLGVGSLQPEFELLGAPFTDRGKRADEALAALRAGLSVAEPEFHGDYYDYSGLVVQPHAQQLRVPLWIGGRTRRSLRRALTAGDGWVPFGLDHDQLVAMLASAEVPDGFEIVLSTGRALDPLSDADDTRRSLERLRAAGATTTGVSLAATGPGHYCDQLAALRELAVGIGAQLDEEAA